MLDGEPLADPPPERRKRDGRLELVAIESADPRWLAASSEALVSVTGRLRAIGSIAVSLCQVAATRVDGMATLWKCRAVDAAAAQLVVRESGGVVAFTAMDDPLGAPLDLEPRSPVVAARTDRGARRAGHAALRLMIDWKLAQRVAEAVAGGDGAGAPQRGAGRPRGAGRARAPSV